MTVSAERIEELRRNSKKSLKADVMTVIDPRELLEILDRVAVDRTLSIVRDSAGRDTRVHRLVLDEGNPVKCLRETLRQWYELATLPPGGSLMESTAEVLRVIGPDGTCVVPHDR